MPARSDIAIAAGLALLGVLEPTVLGSVKAPAHVAAPLTALAVAPLAFRSTLPGPAAAAVLAAIALQEFVAAEPASGMAVLLAMLLAVGTLAARAPARDAAAWGVATLALLSLGVAADPGADAGDFAYAWTMWLLAAGVGRTLRTRSLRAQRAEEEARSAVEHERTRLARELHDVVAHGLSVIHVQSRVAGQLLERDPAEARRALGAIEDTARHALGDMRRMLALLRDEDDARLSPQPGLHDVVALVDRTREAGLPLEYEVHGEQVDLSPGLDLVVYRVVQEALTNVLKHAGPVPTRVRLDFSPDEVVVEVVNHAGRNGSGPASGDGHGLVGMRERVQLFGGEVRAGVRPDGGYAVHARLPLVAA